ncbi:hypothetical protein VCHA30O60_50063 [Vibrio chagasii]|nr:hypothetical protein VCHA30O60_50063 [Vibrio chagasii]
MQEGVGSDGLNGHKCVCGFAKLAKRSLGKSGKPYQEATSFFKVVHRA